jgi:hypothetical protein
MRKVSGAVDYCVLGLVSTTQKGFGVLLFTRKLGSFVLLEDWQKRKVGCGLRFTRHVTLGESVPIV